jgi:Tfp pilus assembly protein PilW
MSLIELMISMVVGLFLLAGVVTNLIGTKDNDRMRDAISAMDANAAQVFEVLRPAIAHAGYSGTDNIRLEKPFYTESDGAKAPNPVCRGGASNIAWSEAIDEHTQDYAYRDKISVISMADNPCRAGLTSCANDADKNSEALVYTDCTGGGADTSDSRVVSCSTDPALGMTDPTQAKIYNTFTLLRNTSSPDDRVLSCQGSRGGTQPIANNVEAIQYLYGVTDAGKTYYRRASQVEAADQWSMVTSVQVGLLMRSPQQYLLEAPASKGEYFLLQTKIEIADEDLKRLFKVYTMTINLENVATGALL